MIRAFGRRRARRRLEAEGADARLLRHLDLDVRPNRRAGLDDERFIVLDCETTGLDAERDRLLSLAAVAVCGGKARLSDRLDLAVKSGTVGGRAAAPVHGLVTRDLEDGVDEGEAVLRFVELLGADVVVAHHAAFDMTVLSRALARLSAPALETAVVDTGHLARRLDMVPVFDGAGPEAPVSLDALALRFGLDIPHRHSAAGDALVTAYVLLALLAKARKRGICTLGDLLAR